MFVLLFAVHSQSILSRSTRGNNMSNPKPSITVNVDPTNPGQFFACCGLLELADRLWPGAEGWFAEDGKEFRIACEGTLKELVSSVANAELIAHDPSDGTSTPFTIGSPFRSLSVDWWETDQTGARDFKVWAGTMESYGIAYAMQRAMRDEKFLTSDLFNIGMVVANTEDPTKKKEPYYFDARRAPNAHSRDIGFSPNDLGSTSIAHPAVELLCLIGLQVARPRNTAEKRVYDYFLWPIPLPTNLILPASSGCLELRGQLGYRFENWFRTGQKKHKAFRSAIPLPSSGV
jgi:CRISPR-associated protein Csx14